MALAGWVGLRPEHDESGWDTFSWPGTLTTFKELCSLEIICLNNPKLGYATFLHKDPRGCESVRDGSREGGGIGSRGTRKQKTMAAGKPVVTSMPFLGYGEKEKFISVVGWGNLGSWDSRSDLCFMAYLVLLKGRVVFTMRHGYSEMIHVLFAVSTLCLWWEFLHPFLLGIAERTSCYPPGRFCFGKMTRW